MKRRETHPNIDAKKRNVSTKPPITKAAFVPEVIAGFTDREPEKPLG
jgi:hypothetical protein